MEQELAIKLQNDQIRYLTQVEIPVTTADPYVPPVSHQDIVCRAFHEELIKKPFHATHVKRETWIIDRDPFCTHTIPKP